MTDLVSRLFCYMKFMYSTVYQRENKHPIFVPWSIQLSLFCFYYVAQRKDKINATEKEWGYNLVKASLWFGQWQSSNVGWEDSGRSQLIIQWAWVTDLSKSPWPEGLSSLLFNVCVDTLIRAQWRWSFRTVQFFSSTVLFPCVFCSLVVSN